MDAPGFFMAADVLGGDSGAAELELSVELAIVFRAVHASLLVLRLDAVPDQRHELLRGQPAARCAPAALEEHGVHARRAWVGLGLGLGVGVGVGLGSGSGLGLGLGLGLGSG